MISLNFLEASLVFTTLNSLQEKKLEYTGHDAKIKFSYFVIKNLKIVQDLLKSFQEIQNKDERYKEYEKKRIELCEKYCKKDVDNKPIRDTGGNYLGLIDNQEFLNEINILREEYKDNLYENCSLDCEVLKIKSSYLPINQDLTIKELNILEKFIDWE